MCFYRLSIRYRESITFNYKLIEPSYCLLCLFSVVYGVTHTVTLPGDRRRRIL